MPRSVKGKKGLYVYLDTPVYEALFRLIHQKYTRLHGVVSSEVQDALVSWLGAHDTTLTQTYTKINPQYPRSHRTASTIILELRRNGFTVQCSMKELSKVIGRIQGSDPRTVRKWTKYLVQNTYLKILRPEVFEIM